MTMPIKQKSRYHIKTKEEWDLLYDDLKVFKTGCVKYNIKWCLFFGSLLGAVRDKDFIQPGAHALSVMLLPPTTRANYFEAMDYFDSKGFWKHLLEMNPSYIQKGMTEGIEMFHIGIDAKLKDYYRWKGLLFHKKFFENLKTAKIRDEDCPIPNYSEELLEILYDKTWRTPILKVHCCISKVAAILLERQKRGV